MSGDMPDRSSHWPGVQRGSLFAVASRSNSPEIRELTGPSLTFLYFSFRLQEVLTLCGSPGWFGNFRTCPGLPIRFYVLFQKIIEHRTDSCNRRKLTDVSPTGRNSRTNDVGSKLKLKTKEKPYAKTHPDFFASATDKASREHAPKHCEQRFSRAEHNQQNCPGF